MPGYPTKEERLSNDGRPKRILALDGGGVRGALSLGYLQRIEKLLRSRHDDAQLVLADYFDLIGGTSTGSIIAGALACRYTVDDIMELYRSLAAQVFQRRWWRKGVLFAKYANHQLDEALQSEFGADTRLDSDRIRTGLIVVCKRMDTGSPWVISNIPHNQYWNAAPGKARVPNREFRLWRVVRASTAAPHYFAPEQIEVGRTVVDGETVVQTGTFIDGGVTPGNNPARKMLEAATIAGYGLNWPLGDDNLLMTSIGTGRPDSAIGPPSGFRRLAAGHAGTALLGLMADCADQVETTMQWLSSSPTARTIDRQVGALENDLLGDRALLSYLRYDVMLDPSWLKDHLELEVNERQCKKLAAMDNAANVEKLAEIGAAAAEKQVEGDHFPARFDLTGST